MIKASYILDNEHVNALSAYTTSREKFRAGRKSLGTLTLISLLIFAFCIYNYISGGTISIAGAIISGVFLYIFGKALIMSFFVKPKAPAERANCDVTFDDDTFGLVVNRKTGIFERHKRYESIHSAVEWNDWFFVYLTEKEACTVKKSEITEGTPEELREFLKNKLGTRFKMDNA